VILFAVVGLKLGHHPLGDLLQFVVVWGFMLLIPIVAAASLALAERTHWVIRANCATLLVCLAAIVLSLRPAEAGAAIPHRAVAAHPLVEHPAQRRDVAVNVVEDQNLFLELVSPVKTTSELHQGAFAAQHHRRCRSHPHSEGQRSLLAAGQVGCEVPLLDRYGLTEGADCR